MRLWKSPVFYLGIALLVGVVTLLAAPFVIDWDRYRGSIESYGRSVTGRDVRIAGPIDARLFPWPRLELSDVRIANPPGARQADLLTIERIDVKMSLSALVSGTLNVQSVDIVKPVLSAERQATGRWTFDLDRADLLANNWLAANVQLDAIAITGGSIHLIDQCRGGEHVFDKIDAVFSAPGFAGPWRARGKLSGNGKRYEVGLNTSSWRAGQEFKFGFRAEPADGSGLIFAFDGGHKDGVTKGAIRLEPAGSANGKSDPEGKMKPMVLKAALEAKAGEIKLDTVEIAPVGAAEEAEGGNLLSGSARVRFCPSIEFSADLKGPRLDLDELLGAKTRDLIRRGAPLRLIQDLLAAMPEGVTANASIGAGVLLADGQVLKDALLKVEAGEGRLKIERLEAKLPGQTDGLFSGVFVSGESGPQLVGDLTLDTKNLRDFVAWAAPDTAQMLNQYWTGSRGRLKLQGQVDLVETEFRLSQAEFQLDQTRGRAYISARYGAEPGGDIGIDADAIDLDQYLPGGFAAVVPMGEGVWNGLSGLLPVLAKPRNFQLILDTSELKLNGVTAKNVGLEVVSGEGGFDLRRLDIGSVGDAKLSIAGLIKQGVALPQGSIGATIEAGHPRELLRLIGAIPADGVEPAWVRALGATKLDATAELVPDTRTPGLVLRAQGRSGGYTLDGEATLAGDFDWRKADIGLNAEIASADSDAMVALAGLSPVVASKLPGRLNVEASGSFAKGLDLKLRGALYGAALTFDAKAMETPTALVWDGHAAVSAEQAQPLFGAIGLPGAPQGLFSAEAQVTNEGRALRFAGLKGLFAGKSFTGDVTLGGPAGMKGELAFGHARLTDLMGLVFLPWNGEAAAADTPLLKGLPFGMKGELWITPKSMTMVEGVELADATLGIKGEADSVQLSLFGKTAEGRTASLEVVSKPKGDGRSIAGQVMLPLELGMHLKLGTGEPVISGAAVLDGRFTGEGRSPAGVLASLTASGSYAVTDGRIANMAPAAFLAKAIAAKSAAEVDAALPLLTSGAGVPFQRIEGTINVQNGVAAFLPVMIKTAEADVQLKPLAELATGDVDLGLTVQLNSKLPLPSLEISFAGAPDKLERRVDASALVADLGFKILQAGVAELERARREEERLAAEAERQRRADAARVAAWEAHRVEMQTRRRQGAVHRILAAGARKRAEEEAVKAREVELRTNAQELSLAAGRVGVYRLLQLASAAAQNGSDGLVTSSDNPVLQPGEAPLPRPRPKLLEKGPDDPPSRSIKKSRRRTNGERPGLPIVLSPQAGQKKKPKTAVQKAPEGLH